MSEVKDRLIKVFQFLQELDQLRNPVARYLDTGNLLHPDQWDEYPGIDVLKGDPAEDTATEEVVEMEPIIRIRRVPPTSCPPHPNILKGWIKPGWRDSLKELNYHKSLNFALPDGEENIVNFEDDAERVIAFNEWRKIRNRWAEKERPGAHARNIYKAAYDLYEKVTSDEDSVEIILADGMLKISESDIRYPMLMQRANLEFDSQVRELRFYTGINKVEMPFSLLRQMNGRALSDINDQLNEEQPRPLGGESTDMFLRSAVHRLFENGEFLDEGESENLTDCPSVWREAVIFTRRPVAGKSAFVEGIIQDLRNPETEPAEGIIRIAKIETDPSSAGRNTSGMDPLLDKSDFDASEIRNPDILFTKEFNQEQFKIAARLTKHRSVVVQGPPGTGKTHTIANLLGYLLSQGKTVLVTAHTTKALRVLREKIDEKLRPLCLNVPGGSASERHEREQFSSAASEILRQLTDRDESELRNEAIKLRQVRQKLMEEKDKVRVDLREALLGEIRDIVFAGNRIKPIDAAKFIKDKRDSNGWIPGPIERGNLCPLSDEDIRALYKLQGIVSAEDEADLSVSQPEISQLVPAIDFRSHAENYEKAQELAQNDRPEFWNALPDADALNSASIRGIYDRMCEAANMLSKGGKHEEWYREILFAGWEGGALQKTQEYLLSEIKSFHDLDEDADSAEVLHVPKYPENIVLSKRIKILEDIVSFLRRGHQWDSYARIRHPFWNRFIKRCGVGADGDIPNSKEQFEALLVVAKMEKKKDEFAELWKRIVEKFGGPDFHSLGDKPARVAWQYMDEIKKRLYWSANVWNPLLEELLHVGFQWKKWIAEFPPVHDKHGELKQVQEAVVDGKLSEVIRAREALMRQKELELNLKEQKIYLVQFSQSSYASALLCAQKDWNPDDYEEAYTEIARLEGLRGEHQSRLEMLEKLKPVAPEWAQAILLRNIPHDKSHVPGDGFAGVAWHWRQLFEELEYRASVSVPKLQERLEYLEKEIQKTAAEIIDKDTWAAQCERTSEEERAALSGFADLINQIGAGTGRYAPRYMRAARTALEKAKGAVPVWIMPLHRVYENFNPSRTKKFDVVIIDEASQSDVFALSALYLGHEHVVIGDDKQVTPDNVGAQMDEIFMLIQQHLNGVVHVPEIFNGQTSIYNFAIGSFGNVLALREHFRCVPDIIEFSNKLSYNGNILPLRESSSSNVLPAVVEYCVSGGNRDGDVNKAEIETIASLVVACIEDDHYQYNEIGDPASFGVISLLRQTQAQRIREKIASHFAGNLGVLKKHRLHCGDAAQFQGDERDIVFISLVDSPRPGGPLPMRGAGARDMYKKRYNVAASRARNQLWVVHSLNPEHDLQVGDMRRRLIEHACNPQMLQNNQDEERADSVFEIGVMRILRERNYRVIPQWQAGAYQIDLVVEGKEGKLAVECDGDRYHTLERIDDDMHRQAVLERLGWRFVRIRGSVFFRDPEAAMQPVFEKLELLGIEPCFPEINEAERSEENQSIERIKRRAAELRRQWAEEREAYFADNDE